MAVRRLRVEARDGEMPQDMVVGADERPPQAATGAGPSGGLGASDHTFRAAWQGEVARGALASAGPVLADAAAGVGGEVTDAERAAALVAAHSSNDIVFSVDAERLGAYVARLKADDAKRGEGVQAEVARLLPASERARFEAAVEENAPGFWGRVGEAIADGAEWVYSRPGAFREWHDGYRPESFAGHVLDGVATLGVGVLDIADFAGSVARVANDVGPLGQAADAIERVWGGELPSWVPSGERGQQSLASAAETVVALASDPKLIWDGLTDNYAELWAEDRYGGLVGQAVADFGDILLGSKGAGRAAGALSDLARAGHLSRLDTVADVLTAARRADTVAPGEFVRVADELAALKRADGMLDQLVDAARRTDTLPDLLGRGILTRSDVADLVRSGHLSLDEAARARLPATGARYIEIEGQLPTAADVAAYDAIIARTDDVAAISDATGFDADMLARVKSHFFLERHQIAVGPDDVRTGTFTPDHIYSDDWNAAAAGTLRGDDLHRFQRFVAHEYIEAKLMEAGLPFNSSHPSAFDATNYPRANPEHFGAHDLSVQGNLAKPPFAHYEGVLDRAPPALDPADDLSNLDAIVEQILEGL